MSDLQLFIVMERNADAIRHLARHIWRTCIRKQIPLGALARLNPNIIFRA